MTDRPGNVNGVPVPYDASVPALAAALRETPDCWAAYVALGYRPEHEAFLLLMDATGSRDWRHRRSAAEALGLHAEGRQAASRLITLLDDSSEYVVRSACDALARLRVNEAHDRVLALLEDPDPDTRQTALRALVVLWHGADFGPVLDTHRGDRSREVRLEAAWTLREHASSSTWRVLFDAWKTDEQHRHRTWACELAHRWDDGSTTADLERLAEDKDGHVRNAAKDALATLG